jgi:UDP-N-acetylglucosamine/UDP-N-acetylgalactosamine diphosphorylase
VQDCYIGPGVALNGGFFQGAVFLKGAACGSGSHVRGGTILEEQAGIAHTVGLKQTILLPYVTLGSLINFCDCLMAGGTNKKDHSEVGSSYIHFNYTPNQDKATPSLIGDVPKGVMLNQSPIFLGGQGGLVGPCRIAYGTIIGAGTICRSDQLTPNRMVFEGSAHKKSLPIKLSNLRKVNRILVNNFYYLANLIALGQWYRHVRIRFIGKEMPELLFKGLTGTLEVAFNERVKQLGYLAQKMNSGAGENDLQRQFVAQWKKLEESLGQLYENEGNLEPKAKFLSELDSAGHDGEAGYLDTIHKLSAGQKELGTQWLASIVQNVMACMAGRLPSLKQ